MSRLYASIDSDSRKTQATSRGHKRIDSHVRGWDSGVRVVARITDDDQDVFDIYATAGSNGSASDVFMGTVVRKDGASYFFSASDPWHNQDEGEGGITPEGQVLGHRYVMGNVNAYCPQCSQEQGVTVLDCDYDLDK